jgi:hypothetical protein
MVFKILCTNGNLNKGVFTPEFKKADYFFKIENTESTMNALKIKTLLNRRVFSTVYSVDTIK